MILILSYYCDGNLVKTLCTFPVAIPTFSFQFSTCIGIFGSSFNQCSETRSIVVSPSKMAQIRLKLECYTGPVTALTVCCEKIIFGCGSELLFYNFTTCKLETRHLVFVGASIHGIREGPVKNQEQLFCLYGAKQIRVVSVQLTPCASEVIFLSCVRELDDWIWDAHWLTNQSDNGSIAVALAHNSVAQWNWKTDQIISHQECVEKCILYCAHFIGDTPDTLILAAGTVFNQVVLWPVADVAGELSPGNNSPIEILHTFCGHKGVIFSICYLASLRRLCSVSDDRSIRMWQLTFPCSQLETPNIWDWKSAKSDLLLSLYGHSARVWDVVLTTNFFVSVGEDATCFLWDYAGNVIQKFKGHKGRNIWSLATSEDEKFVVTGGGDASVRIWEVQHQSEKQTLQNVISMPETGSDEQEDFPRSVKMLNFYTILVMMNSGCLYSYNVKNQQMALIFNDPNFKAYSIVSPCQDHCMLALGSITGVVRILAVPDIIDGTFKYKDMSCFSGKVLALVWLDNRLILASGPCGQLILFRLESVVNDYEEDKSPSLDVQHQLLLPVSKHRWVTSACLVPMLEQQNRKVLTESVLVCGDKDGSIHCYWLPQELKKMTSSSIEPSQSFPKVHGKAGVTFVCYRNGHIYTAGRDGFYRQWEMRGDKLSQLYGNKVLKGFEWIEQLEWQNNDLLVYGFFSSDFVVWSVTNNQQLMSVHCGGGHRAWGCCHDNGMLRFVYLKAGQVHVVESGHHTKQTVVQAALHGRELCDIKFLKEFQDDKGASVYVICTASEDTTINIGAYDTSTKFTSWKPVATLKGHLSSVRTLAVSSQAPGEKIIHSDLGNVKNTVHTNRQYQESGYVILFSGGGRAEMRAWKLNIEKENCDASLPTDHKGHVADSSCAPASQFECHYEHLATHFLGESRHKKQYSTWKTRKLCLDPETRIMSLTASPLKVLWNEIPDCPERLQHIHLLSSAGSDGVLRIFAFDEITKQFSDLAATSFHQGCVLKVLHYTHYITKEGSSHYSFTMSASTNGNVIFWSLEELVKKVASKYRNTSSSLDTIKATVDSRANSTCDSEIEVGEDTQDYIDFTKGKEEISSQVYENWTPFCSLKAHQSGVNALHALQVSDSQCLLASGGDDNAVTVQLLEVTSSNITVVAKMIKADAHAAQVTGIWLISPNILVSTSVDQRICVWNLKTEGGLQLQMLGCKFINVADVSSMDVKISNNSVYLSIAGEGLCLYSFQAEGIEASEG